MMLRDWRIGCFMTMIFQSTLWITMKLAAILNGIAHFPLRYRYLMNYGLFTNQESCHNEHLNRRFVYQRHHKWIYFACEYLFGVQYFLKLDRVW